MDKNTFKNKPTWLRTEHASYRLPALAVLSCVVLGVTLSLAISSMWPEPRALLLSPWSTLAGKVVALLTNMLTGLLALCWLWGYVQKRAAVRRLVAQLAVIEYRLKVKRNIGYDSYAALQQMQDVLKRADSVFAGLQEVSMYLRKGEAVRARVVWHQCAAKYRLGYGKVRHND